MDVATLVVRPGTEVVGWGHLVRDHDGDSFGPPLPTRLIGEPVRRSFLALPVVGADLENVDDRRREGDAVTGTATVTSVYDGRRLEVTHQQRGRPARLAGADLDLTQPPCPTPAAGWPTVGDNGNPEFDTGDLEENGAIVAVSIFRPTESTALVVVAASDPARVEAHLRPQLGDGLCVVPSRFTPDEFERYRAVLDDRAATWGGFSWGESVDGHGQALLTLELVMVTDDVVAELAAFPYGMVRVDPWCRPVSASAGGGRPC